MDCKRMCEIQAELFELSVTLYSTSSEIFVKRFMYSKIVKEFDKEMFLDGNKTINDIFVELDEQYGKSSYGSKRYNRNAMYWVGYLYRLFAFTYEISSRRAYKLLPLKEVIESYDAYHTLNVSQAIERLLEAKGISFKEEDILNRGVEILKRIRKESLEKEVLKKETLNKDSIKNDAMMLCDSSEKEDIKNLEDISRSIDVFEKNNIISKKQADLLRKKYLHKVK